MIDFDESLRRSQILDGWKVGNTVATKAKNDKSSSWHTVQNPAWNWETQDYELAYKVISGIQPVVVPKVMGDVIETPKQYYVERQASGYVGNCLLWWRLGGRGYTCNIEDAEVFSLGDKEFDSICKDKKYRVWPKDYIDKCTTKTVDHQHLNFDKAGLI